MAAILLPLALVALGVVLLVAAAELIVRAGGGLGQRLGLSPLWIGLTIIAVGTSAPELVVSVAASATGEGAIAMGNIAGSNILNVLLVLGLTAAFGTIGIARRTLTSDIPAMLVTSVAVFGLAFLGAIPRWGGALLLLAAVAYTLYLGRREKQTLSEAPEGWATRPMWQLLGAIVFGLAVLVLGGRLVLDGAVQLAVTLGWPDHVVGLTVVALGTSLPELAVSVAAARGGRIEMAVGNVIGSNFMNLTLVLGTAALVRPLPVPDALLLLDLPVMLGASLLLWLFATIGRDINRLEGIIMLAVYVAYMLFLLNPPEWSWV